MALTQVSLQLTEAQMRQIEMLQKLGFGTRSDIVRLALDRMYRQEAETMRKLVKSVDHGDGTSATIHFEDGPTGGIVSGQEKIMNEQKINVILECLHALRRGVDRPTVVLEDDGRYSYIPGAYLTDISYSGSREVVFDVEEESFGHEFDVDAASDAELQAAAAWAATEWDWTPEPA